MIPKLIQKNGPPQCGIYTCKNSLILFDKTLANPNYIPVYMKVNYFLMPFLLKVGRLFCKLAIPKNICVFFIYHSKEEIYFMFG